MKIYFVWTSGRWKREDLGRKKRHGREESGTKSKIIMYSPPTDWKKVHGKKVHDKKVHGRRYMAGEFQGDFYPILSTISCLKEKT